jgi:hypothetical protein
MQGSDFRRRIGLLYDTEVLNPPGSLIDRELHFFTRPFGMNMQNCTGDKTWLDTNMVISCQLPLPQVFHVVGIRLGMSLETPYVDRLRVYAHGVLRFIHGERIILDVPMSTVPCGSLFEFKNVEYANDLVFGDPELPAMLRIMPKLIEAQEVFRVELSWPGSAALPLLRGEPSLCIEGPVPISVYLFGAH